MQRSNDKNNPDCLSQSLRFPNNSRSRPRLFRNSPLLDLLHFQAEGSRGQDIKARTSHVQQTRTYDRFPSSQQVVALIGRLYSLVMRSEVHNAVGYVTRQAFFLTLQPLHQLLKLPFFS